MVIHDALNVAERGLKNKYIYSAKNI
jgi:hypothetical protein